MTKLAVLFAVCLVVLFAAATISAAPSITMEFVGEFRAGRPAIVRVTTTEMNLAKPINITPPVDGSGKTSWGTYIISGQNTLSNMNPDTLLQNNFLSQNSDKVLCVDEATRRPFAQINYDVVDNIMAFDGTNQALHGKNFPADEYGSFTFLCPMLIDTTQAFAPEFIILVATHSDGFVEFSLAPPAAWSWRSPVITINSASYSANTGNLLGGKVKFQFSTDTAGIHQVSVRNGPQPIYYSRRTHEFTSYQCGDNVEAYIIQGPTLQIHVKDSAANGAPITCTVDVDGYMSSAFTERSQIVIEMDTVLVAQGVEFPALDATFAVVPLYNESGDYTFLKISTFDLNFSSSPLHTNSTVEFRFTGIDVNSLSPTTTEYRKDDEICYDLGGTFSHNDKSVFIKDVSKVVNTFFCTIYFLGPKAVRLDDGPVPTIQVLIDGVPLYNRAVRSTSFPLYLPINTKITQNQIQIYQDDSTIKHVVEFSLEDNQSFGFVPHNPILVLSYQNPATWLVDSYADVLSCEVTSPSSSMYEPLVMTFDLPRRVWTADLSTLINVDAYKIKFRCTRSEAVVTKFDIVQNTANKLLVAFFDVISGRGYNYSTESSINEQSPKTYLKKPTSPTLPTEFTQYFTFSGSIFISDFGTVSSVADDVSTKVLDVIKKSYDAYDAQPAAKPAKISPKLVNKANIDIDIDIMDSFSYDYSPSFGQVMYNLFYSIIGHQFQTDILSLDLYRQNYWYTGHQQISTPKIWFDQYFTSGTTYEEIQALSSDAAFFAFLDIPKKFYKDAYSTSPAIPFTFRSDLNSFDPASFFQVNVMNPITACGYYEIGYSATPNMAGTNYEFDYNQMAPSNVSNQVTTRFTCVFAQACSSDADCSSGYCSKGNCAIKPQLKYPYVQYDHVGDFSSYNDYNNSVAVSLSAVIVAAIVAIVM